MRYYFTKWLNGMISVGRDAEDERALFTRSGYTIGNTGLDFDDYPTDADRDLGFNSEDMSRHDFGLMMKERGCTAFAPGVFHDLDESGWTLWSKS